MAKSHYMKQVHVHVHVYTCTYTHTTHTKDYVHVYASTYLYNVLKNTVLLLQFLRWGIGMQLANSYDKLTNHKHLR